MFDKVQVNDRGNRMIMMPDDKECMEIIIDEVNNAPCWRHGNDRCTVDVFIHRNGDMVRGASPVYVERLLISSILRRLDCIWSMAISYGGQ